MESSSSWVARPRMRSGRSRFNAINQKNLSPIPQKLPGTDAFRRPGSFFVAGHLRRRALRIGRMAKNAAARSRVSRTGQAHQHGTLWTMASWILLPSVWKVT